MLLVRFETFDRIDSRSDSGFCDCALRPRASCKLCANIDDASEFYARLSRPLFSRKSPLLTCRLAMLADTPMPVTSEEVGTVADKASALSKRKQYDAMVRASVDKLVAKHVGGAEDDDAAMPRGCISGLTRCNPWAKRGIRVATSEVAISAAGAASAAATAAATVGNAAAIAKKSSATSAASRLFGSRKTGAPESKRLLDAIRMASSKVQEMSERVDAGKKRAIQLKKDGKRTEAILSLKRAKNDMKLLASANAALETLESQRDMLENAALQRELASALASTTKQIKHSTKGLVTLAEKAVDDTQELRDDAEDLNAAFEGIQPTFNVDEDDLIEELNAMMEAEAGVESEKSEKSGVGVVPQSSVATAQAATAATAVTPGDFPCVPSTTMEISEVDDEMEDRVVQSKKADRKASKRPLLNGSSEAATG